MAASLDGFIADADGGFDWIPHDSTVDFAALFERVDTILVGRRTFEVMQTQGGTVWKPGTRVYVVSKSLSPESVHGVTIVANAVETAWSLRNEPGSGEIWLFGGGQLFATLLAARQVDAVEVTVVPVLLGAGVPLVTSGIDRTALTLVRTHEYPSGMVMLHYAVPEAAH
ncbi:MAG: dihydrofolate reductase family protein [Gemmatimonadota bacterium]